MLRCVAYFSSQEVMMLRHNKYAFKLEPHLLRANIFCNAFILQIVGSSSIAVCAFLLEYLTTYRLHSDKHSYVLQDGRLRVNPCSSPVCIKTKSIMFHRSHL